MSQTSPNHPSLTRPYDAIANTVGVACRDIDAHEDRMRCVVDALWDALAERGVSWVGFYLAEPGTPEDEALVLGPRRDKPACSPIGLHGVCGQSFTARAVRIVEDVAELGANYVACDPKDRSEIVLPLFDDDGACWGVLDLDSFDVGSFDEVDAAGLALVLEAAGFSTTTESAPARL